MNTAKSLLLILSSLLSLSTSYAQAHPLPPDAPISSESEPKEERKYAVLLIDANYPQGAFDPRKNINGVWNLEAELENMAHVLTAANAQSLPVFEIYIPVFSNNSEPTTDAELAKYRKDNWIASPKERADAFERTTLDQELKNRKITDVIVMGRNQSACVKETVAHAAQLGYKVHTSFDVIQGIADYAYYDSDCEVTTPIEKKTVPCRSLVKGSGVREDPNHDFNFLHPTHRYIPDNTTVIPADESAGNPEELFYSSNSDLVKDHKDLPIFR